MSVTTTGTSGAGSAFVRARPAATHTSTATSGARRTAFVSAEPASTGTGATATAARQEVQQAGRRSAEQVGRQLDITL